MSRKQRKMEKLRLKQAEKLPEGHKLQNSISSGLLTAFNINQANIAQVSKTDTISVNLRRNLLSNDRELLSWAYAEIGIIQTIVDIPVDDAYRGGIEIQSKELDEEDIAELLQEMEEQDDFVTAAQTDKWNRLYGGAGTVIITDQDPATPLDMKKMKPGSKLAFQHADLWELFFAQTHQSGFGIPNWEVEYFDYYGIKLHKSRVLTRKGITAPSYLRPMLRGWGLSSLECLTRSLNQYLKTVDLTFEVLDEFKIDVFRIKNFASSLLSEGGKEAVLARTQMANMEKNYNHALTMDIEDEYQQKQISFTGLAEVMHENRMQASADTKMPISKIFGVPSSGFSSGEDDIENYNSMIESTIRSKAKQNLVTMVKLRCQQKHGFVPEDLKVSFKPLRILSSEQEENVKTQKFNRTQQARTTGDISSNEFRDAVNRDQLLPIQLESGIGDDELGTPGGDDEGGDNPQNSGKKSTTQTKKAKEAKT